VGLREQLRRLKGELYGELDSFELLDGSRYYYDPASFEVFLFYCECLKTSAHNWPEPPEVVRKLTEAKNVEEAVVQVFGTGPFSFLVYNPDILVRERRLVPRSLVSEYDPEKKNHVPWDPYDERLDKVLGEDLSEPQ
jgi:hypothetical protein